MAKRLAWALFSFCALGAHAQDGVSGQVLTCAAFKDDSERLICYDRLAARLASKEEAPQAVVPEEFFGANIEASAPEDRIERKTLESITSRVTRIDRTPEGGLAMTLENGQVWHQVGAAELLLKEGDTVTISRAALRTFRISTPTGRSARLKRVR